MEEDSGDSNPEEADGAAPDKEIVLVEEIKLELEVEVKVEHAVNNPELAAPTLDNQETE